MDQLPVRIKGRGASSNPDNRFERLQIDYDAVDLGDERPLLRTQFMRDSSKSVVTENNSPDIPFRYSLNPYRGCEHGCAYCYARPTHEFLGFSAGVDFESKILVKNDAPELLREKLLSSSWKGDLICFSGNTDCYQPVERQMRLTRRCLEVMAEFLNPVSVITKNELVTRDLDLLQELARHDAACVTLSVTTLDDELCAALEPRTSRPRARLRAIETLAKAGIPVCVNVAPVIPGLTDHEMPKILKAAREAGACEAGYQPVRLPLTVEKVFTEWLDVHFPDRKSKVLELIRSMRGGKLNDGRFGSRFRGEGPIAGALRQMFDIYSRKEGLQRKKHKLSSAHFRRPGDQLSLF
jgi:DNA repair photolyase